MADKFEILDREAETLLEYFGAGVWDDPTPKTQYWTAAKIIRVLEKQGGIKVYVPKFTDKLKKYGFGRAMLKKLNGVVARRYPVVLLKHKSYYSG